MLDRRAILTQRIQDLAARVPDETALVDVGGRRRTYRELHEQVTRWAGGYAKLGVTAGDTVFTMMPNSFECFDAWLGVAWLRAIEVPANTMYRGSMLAYTLNNSEAKIAVIAQRYVERLEEVADELVHLKRVIIPDANGPRPHVPFDVMTGEEFLVDVDTFDLGDGPNRYDIAAIIYTSGTTGPSKGVLVPWAELYQWVSLNPDGSLEPGRGYYSTFPACHVAGKSLLYYAADRQAYLVIRETFSVTEFWNDIRIHDCQAGGVLGPVAAMLMLAPPTPDDAKTPLENVFMGPLIPGVEEFKTRFGVRVGTGFGMTEIGVPLMTDGFNLVNGQSCGRIRTGAPGYEVRIVDEHDDPVPVGTTGEFIVRAAEPWVMSAGYWKMPEKTAEAWRNGWFHTGDAFREDGDGNFYFVDRVKDAIRRRGENISSFEVEAGVNSHPAVQESAAIGVPSELGEEDVKAFVVVRPNESLDPRDLIEFLVPRMPRFMIPRYVEIVEALPKTDSTLRVRKATLRENALNEQTWDRESAGVLIPRD
jgi:crotonobetaine/carnitine-CoA ligase